MSGARTPLTGTCELCGKSYRKSGMTRHLQSCVAKSGLPREPHRQSVKSIHLFVEDDYRPEYWLHLAMPASATLEELDLYLRRIWLECACISAASTSVESITFALSISSLCTEKRMTAATTHWRVWPR